MGLPLLSCRKVTELDKTKSMASIKKEFIDRITDRQRRDGSDLLDVITSFTGKPKREGSSYKTICPLCRSEHGLTITPGKSVFTCFNCRELSGKDPLAYLMKGQRMDFVEAIILGKVSVS